MVLYVIKRSEGVLGDEFFARAWRLGERRNERRGDFTNDDTTIWPETSTELDTRRMAEGVDYGRSNGLPTAIVRSSESSYSRFHPLYSLLLLLSSFCYSFFSAALKYPLAVDTADNVIEHQACGSNYPHRLIRPHSIWPSHLSSKRWIYRTQR